MYYELFKRPANADYVTSPVREVEQVGTVRGCK